MAAIQLCLITDRTAFGTGAAALDALVDLTRDASAAGIDLIQVREKDLSIRALYELSLRVVEASQPGSARVLVNDRVDVALAARAAGVHLTTRSMTAAIVRSIVGASFVVGVSTHSESEVAAATEGGADFVVCGPVFQTPSKQPSTVLGPDHVASIAAAATLPVVALGGIDEATATDALRESVAGIAAIRMFQETWKSGGGEALGQLVHRLRLLR